MERLADSEPDLHAILRGHDNVLPPRSGGVLALLDTGMDVVIGTHTGLESMRGIGEIWRTAPIGRKVIVEFRRIPASTIPRDPSARKRWLFEEWARVDDTIVEMRSRS
jgi:hypothetical protein